MWEGGAVKGRRPFGIQVPVRKASNSYAKLGDSRAQRHKYSSSHV